MAKLRIQGNWGRWLLFGLGSLAAAYGAMVLYRARFRSRGNTGVSPMPSSFPGTIPGTASRNGIPEQAPDEIPAPEPADAPSAGPAAAPPESEPWMASLRAVMERSPHDFGYGKSAWTAPLLSRYLQDVRGFDVPAPLLRKALKDLGYRWDQTRYVRTHPVQG